MSQGNIDIFITISMLIGWLFNAFKYLHITYNLIINDASLYYILFITAVYCLIALLILGVGTLLIKLNIYIHRKLRRRSRL